MRKLVLALALTSVAFAASTAYFAHELSQERERHTALAAAPSSWPAPGPRAAASSNPRSPTSVPRSAKLTADGVEEPAVAQRRADSEQDIRAAQTEYANTFLRQIDDPQGREEMIVSRKIMMRNSYPRVAEAVGL